MRSTTQCNAANPRESRDTSIWERSDKERGGRRIKLFVFTAFGWDEISRHEPLKPKKQ